MQLRTYPFSEVQTPPPAPHLNGSRRVSIGIPTYNRARALDVAIRSCSLQSYGQIEVVVSDNASTDDTATVCARWEASDERVRVIRQARNIGRESNFQAVLKAATGEFFLWLSDDDWLYPHYVETCVKFLTADPSAALTSGVVEYVDADGAVLFEEGPELSVVHPHPDQRVIEYLSTVGLNSTHYGVMRREAALKCVYPMTLAGDWFFVAQMAVLGNLAVVPDVVGMSRRTDGVSSHLPDLASDFGLSPRWGAHLELWVTRLFIPALGRGTGTFGLMTPLQRLNAARAVVRHQRKLWWLRVGRRKVGVHWAGRVRQRWRSCSRRTST